MTGTTATEQAGADIALLYQTATTVIAGRLSKILEWLWGQVDPLDVTGSWLALLPEAEGAFAAAQAATAAMAEPYVERALTAQGVDVAALQAKAAADAAHARGVISALTQTGVPELAPGAFTGATAAGWPLDALLTVPAERAAVALRDGARPADVLRAGRSALQMYASTEVHDVARASVQTVSTVQHVDGYVRHIGFRCCGRCAVLSGRWYRYSSGFERHPRCRCTMVPASRDVEITTPLELYRQGRITDLTRAEREALDMGADISQVVNSRMGMYVAGGEKFTVSGTTRRGVAGARMIARDIARAGGAAPGGTYTNYTVDRRRVAAAEAKYGPLMRRGNPFTRATKTGPENVAGYWRAANARPTVATILKHASTREERVRLLTNYGYLLDPAKVAAA